MGSIGGDRRRWRRWVVSIFYLFILQHPLTSIMCSRAVSARIKARF